MNQTPIPYLVCIIRDANLSHVYVHCMIADFVNGIFTENILQYIFVFYVCKHLHSNYHTKLYCDSRPEDAKCI